MTPVVRAGVIKKYFRSVGGYHFMYADTFLTREEFEEMFDLTAYDLVRKKYFAEGKTAWKTRCLNTDLFQAHSPTFTTRLSQRLMW